MSAHITEIEYLDYHKQFATSHKKLMHLSEGAHSFMGFNEEELYMNMNRTSTKRLGDFIMLMEPPAGRFVGDAEMISDEILAGFSILGAVKDVDSKNISKIHQVSSECKVIGIQILTRMKKMATGQLDNTCSQVAATFQLNQVTYEPVTHINIGYHGYLFRYPLRSKTPISYEESAWQ